MEKEQISYFVCPPPPPRISQVLSKTLDMTKMTSDKIELAVLQRDTSASKTTIRIMSAEEVTSLIKKYEAAEKAAEEAKREKEKQQQAKQKTSGGVSA